MNRRLPYFALLVVLLVAMTGFLALDGDAQDATPPNLDQPTPCVPTTPGITPTTTLVPLDLGTTVDTGAQVQTVTLKAGETVSITAIPHTFVWIKEGSVTLTLCEGDQIAVDTNDGTPAPRIVGPDTTQLLTVPLNDGDSVYAVDDVVYTLKGEAAESYFVVFVVVDGAGGYCGGTSC